MTRLCVFVWLNLKSKLLGEDIQMYHQVMMRFPERSGAVWVWWGESGISIGEVISSRLCEFRVDDVRVLVPVVDTDPHLESMLVRNWRQRA